MSRQIKIQTDELRFSYNGMTILRGINQSFPEKEITAIIGPSGSGKSTFLMTLNRLWEALPNCSLSGKVFISLAGGFEDIYAGNCSAEILRRRVGMVFQMPNPLPMSIYRNVAFPLTLAGRHHRDEIRAMVEDNLKKVKLWSEVRDRLDSPAHSLSGGQQQRLCLARALILEPEVLLLDEPTSALDFKSAGAIEELLLDLKSHCTILVVSHYLDQVKRIADQVVLLENGMITPGQD